MRQTDWIQTQRSNDDDHDVGVGDRDDDDEDDDVCDKWTWSLGELGRVSQILRSHHRNRITNIAANEFGSEGMVNGVLLLIHIFRSLQMKPAPGGMETDCTNLGVFLCVCVNTVGQKEFEMEI